MSQHHSVHEARARLPEILVAVQRGSAVEIVRDGSTVAVVVGVEEYARIAEPPADVWESYRAFCAAHPLRELDLT